MPFAPHVKRSRAWSWQFSAFAVACVVAVGPAAAQAPSGGVNDGLAAAAAVERALVTAIQRCEASVVAIARVRNSDANPARVLAMPNPTDPDFVPNDFATGVIVGASGLVLTNFHVLGEMEDSSYWVTTNDRQTYRALPKAADQRSDLAVLEMVTPNRSRQFKPIPFGDASRLRKGQIVVALGNPYAIARDGSASASWGIVSNLDRKIPYERDTGPGAEPPTLKNFATLIQTDAKLNLGTSGGALIDLAGRMVGLTTALAAKSGHELAAGYAIAIDEDILRIIETLKQGREVEYGFLGVLPTNLTYEARLIGGLHGVRIEEVVPGTPAAQSGLKRNDIVSAVEGEPIFDKDGLMFEVGKQPVGSPVRLSVLRGDGERERRLTLVAELAKLPTDDRQYFTVKSDAWRGLRVDYATAEPTFTRLNPSVLTQSNCVIREVESDSPAAEAGLSAQSLITHVNGRRVKTPKEFWQVVKDLSDTVELEVWRPPTERRTVAIEPE